MLLDVDEGSQWTTATFLLADKSHIKFSVYDLWFGSGKLAQTAIKYLKLSFLCLSGL